MDKTQMIARVRVVIDVPFEFAIDDPDESGHSETRIDAAKHAETVLMDKVTEALVSFGTVVDDETLIVQVSEA